MTYINFFIRRDYLVNLYWLIYINWIVIIEMDHNNICYRKFNKINNNLLLNRLVVIKFLILIIIRWLEEVLRDSRIRFIILLREVVLKSMLSRIQLGKSLCLTLWLMKHLVIWMKSILHQRWISRSTRSRSWRVLANQK